MTLPWHRDYIVNWSRTERSLCYVYEAHNVAGIMHALTTARTNSLSVIPHGAGHSYTDAALNTEGVLVDLTAMRRILSWDPEHGVMQVEPGVTLRDVVRVALLDGWWPAVTPSTAEATIGGCVAMNVNGKNAWKCGSFGEHILSLTVLLANGQVLTLSPESDPRLFHALVGSAGLLGIITSITLQLRRIPSSNVDVLLRPAASIGEILEIFEHEQSADFLEAWLDGLASERDLGRGLVISTRYSAAGGHRSPESSDITGQLKDALARGIGNLCQPAVTSGVRTANRAVYWWTKSRYRQVIRHRSLFDSTYYPRAMYSGSQALFPHGTETFQAFVPRHHAGVLFEEILRRSQANHFMPLWCVVKRHRRDNFLLSYQVDGYSLEVNYAINPKAVDRLHGMLRALMELMIASGGRFYLAKDSLLTHALYRQSIGDGAVEELLQLKQRYDPEMLFQSDLFRRVFQPGL